MTKKKPEKPQQVDGPEVSEPEPYGEQNWDSKPQNVDGGEPVPAAEPIGEQNWDEKPQQVDGPDPEVEE